MNRNRVIALIVAVVLSVVAALLGVPTSELVRDLPQPAGSPAPAADTPAE